MSANTNEVEAATKAKPNRTNLRSEIFSGKNSKPQAIEYTFNGVQLEWRQPTVKQIQEARDETGVDKNFMTTMIIEYSFIPGTDEKVFEEGDRESLENMPFGGNWSRALNKIQSLLDLGVEDEVKN